MCFSFPLHGYVYRYASLVVFLLTYTILKSAKIYCFILGNRELCLEVFQLRCRKVIPIRLCSPSLRNESFESPTSCVAHLEIQTRHSFNNSWRGFVWSLCDYKLKTEPRRTKMNNLIIVYVKSKILYVKSKN